MAGPSGNLPSRRPPVRASDAEREKAVAALRERFAAGQLSQDTFVHRMEVALAARDRSELAELFADLPLPKWLRAPDWSALARLGPRLAAAASPLLDAVIRSARRVPGPWDAPLPPGLAFPVGSQIRFTIGRDPECDLVIPDITVSRQHAGLDRCLRGWLLTDFGSTNGTRLNGWRVREPMPVRPGDRVTFGDVTFVLWDSAAIPTG
jgi:hypothetical protein